MRALQWSLVCGSIEDEVVVISVKLQIDRETPSTYCTTRSHFLKREFRPINLRLLGLDIPLISSHRGRRYTTMKASTLLRSSRAGSLRLVHRSTAPAPSPRLLVLPLSAREIHSSLYPSNCAFPARATQASAPFSTSSVVSKGIQPDSAEPEPPKTEATSGSVDAAQISDAEYHEIADQYLDTLVLSVEELSESTSDGVEVEYSVCTTALMKSP